MADALRSQGPDAVLEVVYGMEINPDKGIASLSCDREQLVPMINKLQEAVGGRETMELKMADATRLVTEAPTHIVPQPNHPIGGVRCDNHHRV